MALSERLAGLPPGAARLVARLLWGTLRRPGRRVGLPERLGMLPTRGLPLRAPVAIRWNDRHVPYIEAAHDTDLAVALGVVHAHLRLAQIEFMRRAAWGRLAEVLGPAALGLDHTLRILNLPKAVPGIRALLPETTRAWLEGFAAGINAVIAHTTRWPEEFDLLGFRPEPWTLDDVLALGRLAGTDFTWRVWVLLLGLREREDWPDLWARLMRDNALPLPGFSGGGFPLFGVQGSNALAVAAEKSATGAALLAGDPHLSITLPNSWILAGMQSPGINAVGLMIPGVPAVALGRNWRIGWGGTNLHAQSSELFDVSDLPTDGVIERRETIRVRWAKPVEVTVRETEYGPIVSDSPLLRTSRQLALHWVGHVPSDEMTALLGVNRAGGWDEFLAALDGFAVPAQTMVYADVQGRVGQCMAAKLPRRPHGPPSDLFAPRTARRHWQRFATATTLPRTLAPEGGYVASANNRPDEAGDVPVGFFFSPDDRVRRLRMVLEDLDRVSVEHLKALQRDVAVPSAPELRDRLLEAAERAGASAPQLFARLEAWDGRYDADSRGALAFELLLHHLACALRGADGVALYTAGWEPWAILRDDLDRTDPGRLADALREAVGKAARDAARFGSWGTLHRLRLMHPLGLIPALGRRWRFMDEPAAGGNETLMKTAHGLKGGVHGAQLGSCARYVCDFADPDANGFALLGGQDGWLGSDGFLDQMDLWREGRYVPVPLRAEAARAMFVHTVELAP